MLYLWIKHNSRIMQTTIIPVIVANLIVSPCLPQPITNHIFLSAKIDDAISGVSAVDAYDSVMRLLCIDKNTFGSAFLHTNNEALTAAHVVKDCGSLVMLAHNGSQIPCTVRAEDDDLDIAVVTLKEAVIAKPLELASEDDVAIGTEVSTWGYPAGYGGVAPLLSVGYLAGLDGVRLEDGNTETRWVVNGAFNSGNSGGPLLRFDTGKVIGIVSSKLAPISPTSRLILDALSKEQTGIVRYTETMADGTKKEVTQGNILASVIDELRAQVQLVIGFAVTAKDIRQFLKANKID